VNFYDIITAENVGAGIPLTNKRTDAVKNNNSAMVFSKYSTILKKKRGRLEVFLSLYERKWPDEHDGRVKVQFGCKLSIFCRYRKKIENFEIFFSKFNFQNDRGPILSNMTGKTCYVYLLKKSYFGKTKNSQMVSEVQTLS
jgi:hypothetical protein